MAFQDSRGEAPGASPAGSGTPNVPVGAYSLPTWTLGGSTDTRTLSLPEQIAEAIGTDIIQERYRAGERIHEQALADRFKVSRGPVRDALKLLERDGLVQISARRGTHVSRLSAKELIDVFNIRVLLFGLAARQLAEGQHPQALAQLKEATNRLATLAAGDDADAYLTAIYHLNWMLPSASGNRHLANIMLSLTYLSLRYGRQALSSLEGRQRSAQSWASLANAITEGRADDADQIAQGMIRRSRDLAVQHLASRPELSDPDADN